MPQLDLGLLSAASKDVKGRKGEESKFDHVMALQEEPIHITFLLPDDSTVSSEVHSIGISKALEVLRVSGVLMLMGVCMSFIQFKKGHTIAVLKAFLEDEYDLKQEETQLCLDGNILLDPFSLTDFPCVLEASAIDIQVRRTSSDDAKSRK